MSGARLRLFLLKDAPTILLTYLRVSTNAIPSHWRDLFPFFKVIPYLCRMRKKLLRFQDNALAPNVIELGKPIYEEVKKRFHTYFGNKNPIILELGCGRGTYTLALAARFPEMNVIGIDVKGSRLWAGSQAAMEKKLNNAAFLRGDALQLDAFFNPGEVAAIYLPFPDPRPREKDEKKRLTSPKFLALYKKVLRKGGELHLKTDNTDLFTYSQQKLREAAFTLEVESMDVYAELPLDDWHRQVQTPYEKRFLAAGEKIKYIRCRAH